MKEAAQPEPKATNQCPKEWNLMGCEDEAAQHAIECSTMQQLRHYIRTSALSKTKADTGSYDAVIDNFYRCSAKMECSTVALQGSRKAKHCKRPQLDMILQVDDRELLCSAPHRAIWMQPLYNNWSNHAVQNLVPRFREETSHGKARPTPLLPCQSYSQKKYSLRPCLQAGAQPRSGLYTVQRSTLPPLT